MTDAPSEVLVVGEALIDVIEHGDVDEHGGVEHRVGGSPLNVAVGVSRLGLPSRLHSRFGRDADGDLIARHLADSGVRVTPGSRDAEQTSRAIATLGPDGSARYRFRLAGALAALEHPGDPSVVHTGSIGAVRAEGVDALDDILDRIRSRATISYDPNVRPLLMTEPGTRERIARLARESDIVKVSDEDLTWLRPEDPLGLARSWRDAGVPLVIVTRGAAGAVAFTPSGQVEAPSVATAVADTVGAGDSFMAATLAALDRVGALGRDRESALRGLTVETVEAVLRFAAACAALTVGRIGADPPWRADVAELLPPAHPEP